MSIRKVRMGMVFCCLPLILLCQKKPFITSLEFKYSQTKYNSGGAVWQGSTASEFKLSTTRQLLAGLAREVSDGVRIGAKTGITLDKLYSSFIKYKNINSKTNLQLFIGLNLQKRLITDKKRWVSLWAAVDISAEPYISRKSLFDRTVVYDSIPENDLYIFEGLYYNKKTRFGITPSIKAEIKLPKNFNLFVFAGYAVELGKSNLRVYYNSNRYLFNVLPFNEKEFIKENYLFAGAGINYTIFKN